MLDWSSHTSYSDPDKHRDLLRQLPDNVDAICAAARNVIGHYRPTSPTSPTSAATGTPPKLVQLR
jgi:hypothetical protein